MASAPTPLPFVKLNYGWNKGWYKLHPGGLFKADAEKYQKVIFIGKLNTTKEINSGVFDLDADGISERIEHDVHRIPYYKIKPYDEVSFGSANNPYIDQSKLTNSYHIYGLSKGPALTDEEVNKLESEYYEKIKTEAAEKAAEKAAAEAAAEAAHRKKSSIGRFFGYFRKSTGGKRKSRRKKNKQQKNTTRRRRR